MSNLQQRQQKIKAVKLENTFEQFLLDIASWYPLVVYKNNGLISLYPDHERSCPVISHKEFEEEIPSLLEYGIEYDYGMSFFENFKNLFLQTPFSALYNYSWAENSDFAFSALNSKNCYLSFTVISDCENICYSFAIKEGCINVFYSAQVSNHSENIYMSTCIVKGFNIFFSKFIENSSNIRFCTNMIGCHDCLFCDGLENQSYCIDNEQLTKEEYEAKKQELLSDKAKFETWYVELNSQWKNHGSTDVKNGNFVLNSHEVENGMYSFNLKDARNTLVVWSPNENRYIYDAFEAGSLGNTHFYGVMNTGVNSEHVYNSEWIVTCFNIYYSRFLENCRYCLGCIGLRNQQYCILNKQYEKEEWFEKVNEIFDQMDKDGLLGQYFPWDINPFYFNDTIASLVGDFDKEEIMSKWYLRREEEIKVDIPEWMEVVSIQDLSDYEGMQILPASGHPPLSGGTKISEEREGYVETRHGVSDEERQIDPAILKKVIRDEEGNVYRVIKMEYDFLMKHGLPLPKQHWMSWLKQQFRLK